MKRDLLRQLPAVNTLLQTPELTAAVATYGVERITPLTRIVLNNAREELLRMLPQSAAFSSGDASELERACEDQNSLSPEQVEQILAKLSSIENDLVERVLQILNTYDSPSLREVINATGVILHTNLGRAVLGQRVLEEIEPVITGYTNLEYDLNAQHRGERDSHLVPLLTLLTGAEEAAVVNNNAAALILALSTLAKGREVIISRGELVEIGGSFRIPEILEASGAIMVEVGTTNKTHLRDYEAALTPQTALILKAHRSNFDIVGFTEEVSLSELSQFAHQNQLPFLYDMGSGLIRKPELPQLESEPDVRSALRAGVDIVTFSGDKLLGGAQAGLLVGAKRYLAPLKKAPIMRALRVDKLTISVLSTVMRSYLTDQALFETLPFYRTLLQSEKELFLRAEVLQGAFQAAGVECEIVSSIGRCGGGTLPSFEISSYAVRLKSGKPSQQERSQFAETIYRSLHHLDPPVVGIIKQGDLLFDLLTLEDHHLPILVQHVVSTIHQEESHV